jgi:hypothetical protein
VSDADNVPSVTYRLSSSLLVLALVASGCGLTSSVEEIPINEASIDDATIAAINALVPAGVPVEFEEIIADDDGKIAYAVAPDLWKIETPDVGVEVFPIPGSGVHLDTLITLEAVCVGVCGREDWSEYLYNDAFSPFNMPAGVAIVRDEPLAGPEGRSLVAERVDGISDVIVARWNDDATHFFLCRVSLQPEDAPLVAAFTAACEAAIPLWVGR